MAERDAQPLQIGLGHVGQDFKIDGILGKDGRVLGEPDPIQPGFYLVIDAHCRVLSPPTKSIVTFPLSSLHILLCTRRDRPRGRRAAEKRNELAPSQAEHRGSSNRLARRRSVYRTLSLPQIAGYVLGADLNCSESRRWPTAPDRPG